MFNLAAGQEGRSGQRSDLKSVLLWILAGTTAGMAVLRLALGARLPSTLFATASLLFVAGGLLRSTSRGKPASAGAPWVCLALCFSVALAEGGLYADVLFWVPFLPLVATVFAHGAAAMALSTVAVVGVAVLLFVDPMQPTVVEVEASRMGLRAAALVVAVMVGAFVAVAQERDRDARHKRLWRRVSHHPLSGLKSREFFMDVLRIAVDRARRGHTSLALVFIDLDGLKLTNDTHGHAAGDELIRESARRIQAGTRAGDVACHMGGDEFVVLVEPCAAPDEAETVARRIREAMGRPLEFEGKVLENRASFGVAVYRPPESPQDLVRRADRAMYQVKNAGGDGVFLEDRPDGASPSSDRLERYVV